MQPLSNSLLTKLVHTKSVNYSIQAELFNFLFFCFFPLRFQVSSQHVSRINTWHNNVQSAIDCLAILHCKIDWAIEELERDTYAHTEGFAASSYLDRLSSPKMLFCFVTGKCGVQKT